MGVCWENRKARHHLEDLGKDRRIILNWIFKKWIGIIWVRTGTYGQAPVNPEVL
jgi:hypothetical protein